MGWFFDDDGYKRDSDGGFWDKEEAERAADNGDIRRLNNGSFWDPDSDDEYWPDGTKK